MKVVGKSHCPDSHHGSICYDAEATKPHHTWERIYQLEYAIWWSHQNEWTTSHSWVKGTYSVSLESHCPGASHTCWNTLCLKWNTDHRKRGRDEGPGLAFLSSVHFLILDSAAFLTQHIWYVQPSQVPEHVLFSTGKITWLPSLFPPLAWRTL